MRNLDMLAKTCEPQAPQSSPGQQNLEIVTDELVNRIADAVLNKLTAQQSGKDNEQSNNDPEPPESNENSENEGGETDGNEP